MTSASKFLQFACAREPSRFREGGHGTQAQICCTSSLQTWLALGLYWNFTHFVCRDLGKLCLDYIQGFILNIPTDYKLMGYVKLPLKRKHWITVRKVQGSYYNLDSKLDAPKVIGQEKELLDFLRDQVQNVEKELLLAVTTEVAQSGDWYRFDDLSRPEREAVLREHVDGSNGVPSFPDDVTLNSEENSGAGGAQRTCRVTVKTCAEEGDSTANNS